MTDPSLYCGNYNISACQTAGEDWGTKISFWVFAPISSYLSLLLIIGYFKYEKLRKRPGDIILGISISSFFLTMYWTLTAIIPEIKYGCSCYYTGIFISFTSFANYVYNVAFVYYFLEKLRNLLKQERISKPWIIHSVCLLASFAFIAYLIPEGIIGQSMFGTCSKKFECDSDTFTGTLVVLFYLVYEVFSIGLYLYIKRRFSHVMESSNREAEKFVVNYRAYLIFSSILWLLMVAGIAYSEFINIPTDKNHNPTTTDESTLTRAMVSFNNFVSVFQSIILTWFRYKDSRIQEVMKRLFFFWRKTRKTDLNRSQPLLAEQDKIMLEAHSRQLRASQIRPSVQNSSAEAYLIEVFSKKRKLDLTLSVLSSIMIAYIDRKYLIDDNADMGEKLEHNVLYEINEKFVFDIFSNAKEMFSKLNGKMIPTKVQLIAPSFFKKIVDKEIGCDEFLKSFDFELNESKIKQEQQGNGGKGGEFFFFTADNKLIIKSLSDKEMEFQLTILEAYCKYLEQNPETLITRIYGILKLEWQYRPLNLIIMKNMCPYPKECVEKSFDMKGSTYERRVLHKDQYKDQSLARSKTLKDLDFLSLEESIRVSDIMKRKIFETLKKDAEFLGGLGLIDYSLILFIVNKQKYSFFEKEANVENHWSFSVPMENNENLCYSMGIIDLLQTYTCKKRMEKIIKMIINCNPKLQTSSQNPRVYKRRFLKFFAELLGIEAQESIRTISH